MARLVIIANLLCLFCSAAAQFFDLTSCTGLQVKSTGSSASAQPPSTIPFMIEVAPSRNFYPGNALNVTVRAKDTSRNTFQGIMLQVRPTNEDLIAYGTWGFPPNTGFTFLPCLGNSVSTIVNANDDVKTLPLSLAWISPPDPQLPNIQIVASVVEEADIFWENVPMIELQVINDTSKPVKDNNTCPDSLIVQAYVLPGENSRAVTWDEPTATDDSGNLMITRTHVPGDNFPIGATVVVYTFTDFSGNEESCHIVVLVDHDREPPEVTCPDDVTARVAEEFGGKIIVWTDPEVSDNSDHGVDLMSQTNPKGTFFPIGVTKVTYMYQDKSGNMGQCSFNVTVSIQVDFTPPVVNSCPTDIFQEVQFNLTGAFVNWREPTATDDTTESVVVMSNRKPTEFFFVGVTNVTYIFSDEDQNKAYCIFNVTVLPDTNPPLVDCPNSINIHVQSGAEGKLVDWSEPTAIDQSGDVKVISQSHDPGQFFTIGSTMVNYTFQDSSGNTALCSFNVIVKEQEDEPEVQWVLYASAGGGSIIILVLFIFLSVFCYRLGKRRGSQSENTDLDLKNQPSHQEVISVEGQDDDDQAKTAQNERYSMPPPSDVTRELALKLPADTGQRYSRQTAIVSGGAADPRELPLATSCFDSGDIYECMDEEQLNWKRDLNEIIGASKSPAYVNPVRPTPSWVSSHKC